jgi:hypothetical protein
MCLVLGRFEDTYYCNDASFLVAQSIDVSQIPTLTYKNSPYSANQIRRHVVRDRLVFSKENRKEKKKIYSLSFQQ